MAGIPGKLEGTVNVSHGIKGAAWLLTGGILLVGRPAARVQEGVEGVTAVSSKVSGGYVRARLPDGSLQPEFYAFGEGGNWAGEISDATIDKIHFTDVARVIAGPLASRNYIPARDPALLLTMQPGAYTATITSAKGNSGTALFEAYAN